MIETYVLHRGTTPLLVSLPHDGIALPDGIAERLTPAARRVPDTDWHVARLYAFARDLGASMIVPKYSRYVVDLNRPRDDVSLYPGQNTTGLCPIVQFSGEPVYLAGAEPAAQEVSARIEAYWLPYHEALAAELARIRAQHGRAVLWEAHSIRGVVPFLFEGRLPDFNLGTAGGASCSVPLHRRLETILAAQVKYSFVVNGRFKGGYITRRYGAPANGVDAVQLELAQLNYMDEATFEFSEALAAPTRSLIRALLEAVLR
ncbi:MAG: N-formylglutamate deformylase [Rudaea sp.]